MANLTDALTLIFVDHSIRLIQAADGLTKENNDRMRQLASTIAAIILAMRSTSPAETAAALVTIREAIEVAYAAISARSVQDITALASIEASFVVSAVNQVSPTAIRLPRISAQPAVGGVPLEQWWDAQAKDTASRIAATIRTGISAAYTLEQIVATIATPIAAAGRHAQTLTDSAVQRVVTDTRQAVFKVNEAVVNGMQVSATLDSKTCAQCLAYDGSTYDLDGNPTGNTVLPWNGGPAFHFGCRCFVTGVIGEPADKLTAERWLDSKSPAQQDEILGKGRAALYRKGSLTLRDLVSGSGQQLSLADLREKYKTND